ncbi:MAG: histidine--tRNA ligase [Lachnospiraceae bacterium]|nr:histidine--tRNA ligase [Lachnospiraceae bacterium]
MANITEPRTLSGFMELLPDRQVIFNKIRRKLEDIYSLYGFYPLDTPVLEYSEVLLAKAGGETEKQIYRFNKGDTDLSMRFDLTVPLAKYVAKNAGELTFPFKRYQIGKVYRGERAQKGRFREFYQSDIDIIGDGELSLVNDAEIPGIIYRIFTELGITDFTIRVNNRKVLGGLFGLFGLGGNEAEVLRIIDKIEKIGGEAVKEELSTLGIDMKAAEELLELLTRKCTSRETIETLRGMSGKSELLDEGVNELAIVTEYLTGFGVPEKNFRIDLTIARGLDYYTGTVYETMINSHPEIGSVCSGGRYENLAGFYTNRKLPGVGISIGLTRLFYVLNENGWLSEDRKYPSEVLVIPMGDDFSRAIEVSEFLRGQGISSQIYYEKKKFKARIGYADKLSIPFCIFIGEDEIKEGNVSLKNMTDGVQEKYSLEDCANVIKKVLADDNARSLVKSL